MQTNGLKGFDWRGMWNKGWIIGKHLDERIERECDNDILLRLALTHIVSIVEWLWNRGYLGGVKLVNLE